MAEKNYAELLANFAAKNADLNRRWAEKHCPMTYETDEDGDVTVYSASGQFLAWMDKAAWDAIRDHQAKAPTDG